MNRHHADDSHDADDDDWDVDATEGADDEVTLACPACHRHVYDDAEQCPHCGHYISDDDRSGGPKPLLIIVGTILCLLVVIYWLIV
jgi:hypothetical protein